MIDRERLEVLAAMVAAGAADDGERRELDELLQSSPAAVDELARMEEAISLVALDGDAEPPAGGLDAVRARLAAQAGSAGGVPASPAEDSARAGTDRNTRPAEVVPIAKKSRANRALIASTVLSLAAAAGFAVSWSRERDHVAELRDQIADNHALRDQIERARRAELALTQDLTTAQRELEDARRRLGLIRDSEIQLATIGTEDGSNAKIFMAPGEKQWLVYAHALPRPAANQDYQLWFVPKTGEAPIPAGLLRTSDGVLEAQVEVPADAPEIGQAAISLEPKGGSLVPTDVRMIGPI